MRRAGRLTGTAAAALASCLALAACSGGGDGNGTDDGDAADSAITFWTPHVQPDRMAAQQEIAAEFTAESGIEVEVVAMAGADQDQALITGAASGDVPDVVLHAPDLSAWQSQGLVDSGAATSVIESLGADTFNQQALDFITIEDTYQAIPADGWVHLIAYRTDLLDEAGISVPASLDELADAAQTIRADVGITGMAMGTQAGTPSATEAIESTFQQTGCELVQDGTVTFDSPECVQAAGNFATLADSSAAGPFDVLSARSAYLNGDAAFLLFSTHILDELAGLDADNPLTCDECADNENFLMENTGFITVLDESNPAQYGTTLNYVIPEGANAEGASEFVEYMLSDGYSAMLGTAPEGRIPLRPGTADSPTEYLDAWGTLPMGGSDQSVADLYGDELVTSLGDGMNAVSRWGFGTEDAVLAGEAFAQNTLAEQLEALYSGTDPEQVVADMAAAVQSLQDELG
ncbi:extracellular solute-binding protein [Ruania alkalisoli]|uniref:Extracellular solute-binding protein n=1 Tax=Ruania alkalisoli TaxID=2779775 RepID=A0A7M1STP9_9MICO|nr:extracellular solute-binding protein [Ruania alkalisoli]QOR70324.1 extracellular solute-binding protein [Ruania alkalisoli]